MNHFDIDKNAENENSHKKFTFGEEVWLPKESNDLYFDVAIVGGGPGGIFAALELSQKPLKIVLLDKGCAIEKRIGKCISACGSCKICHITHGLGGAGLFSDGKCRSSFNISKYFGTDYDCTEIANGITESIVKDCNKLNININKKNPSIDTVSKTKKELKSLGLDFTYFPVKHLGSDASVVFTKYLIDKLYTKGVSIQENSEVVEITKGNEEYELLLRNNGTYSKISAKYIVLSVGKSGTRWLNEQTEKLKIKVDQPKLFVGIRIETNQRITKKLTDLSFDPKISMHMENGDYVKTHCWCEGGHIMSCNYQGLILLGGHAFLNEKSNNTIFALLSSFEVPKEKTLYDYSYQLIKNINERGSGKILLQRLDDFINRDNTTIAKIENHAVSPTLKNFNINRIDLILPNRIYLNIKDFILRLNEFCPGLIEEGLVYAPALEWWSQNVLVTQKFEANVKNIYIIGEASGVAKGIIGSATTGILAASDILSKIENNLN